MGQVSATKSKTMSKSNIKVTGNPIGKRFTLALQGGAIATYEIMHATGLVGGFPAEGVRVDMERVGRAAGGDLFVNVPIETLAKMFKPESPSQVWFKVGKIDAESSDTSTEPVADKAEKMQDEAE